MIRKKILPSHHIHKQDGLYSYDSYYFLEHTTIEIEGSTLWQTLYELDWHYKLSNKLRNVYTPSQLLLHILLQKGRVQHQTHLEL